LLLQSSKTSISDTFNPHYPHPYPHTKILHYTHFLRIFHIIHRRDFNLICTFSQLCSNAQTALNSGLCVLIEVHFFCFKSDSIIRQNPVIVDFYHNWMFVSCCVKCMEGCGKIKLSTVLTAKSQTWHSI
jgi:hypothetical protein